MSTCILCETPLDSAPVVGTIARGGKDSRRVACLTCGLVQCDPMPDPKVLEEYYRGDYHRDHPPTSMLLTDKETGEQTLVEPGSAEYDYAVHYMHKERAEAVVRELSLPRGARILEVGCAEGDTLEILEFDGMVCCGLEPDASKAGMVMLREPVYTWTLEQAVNEGLHGFDALIAFHVLEHFPDPLAALGLMRKLLKPGGQVFLEVPNVMMPGTPLTEHWQWVHLYDFSAGTSSALLHRAGFVNVTVDSRTPQLRIWAVSGNDEGVKPFESFRVDMNGRAMADFLASVDERAAKQDTRTITQRFLEGESLASIGYGAEAKLRAEYQAVKASTLRMSKAYHDGTELIGELSNRYAEECFRIFEEWDPDPFLYGMKIGRASAYHEAKSATALVGNAMRMVQLTDGEK